MIRLGTAILLVFGFLCGAASAHSYPPALLDIRPTSTGTEITFRVPRLDGVVPAIDLVLPDGFVDTAPPTRINLPDADVRRRVVSGPPEALAGRRIRFPGVDFVGIDVLVRGAGADHSEWTAVATPTLPFVECPPTGSLVATVRTFFIQGTRHILFGPDHLLFVLGLLTLVRERRSLLLTITSFTAAHSLTLGLATYGLAIPPTRLLNALIALSILYLGVEIVAARRGQPSWTATRPWLAAFAFGLLHGFGFAGALTEAGLAPSEIATALIAFNLGVEAGQLAFVGLALAVSSAIVNLDFPRRVWLHLAPGYAVGIPGAFWTIDRGLAALGVI